MPPISTGRDPAFGVTIRLAPRPRSSRFTRSPISSITPSMAVATAEARATAASFIALRRGARRIDSLTKRRNMLQSGIAKQLHAWEKLAGGNHQPIALHPRIERNRIAPAARSNARNENGGAAVLADHVGTILIVTLVATD